MDILLLAVEEKQAAVRVVVQVHPIPGKEIPDDLMAQ